MPPRDSVDTAGFAAWIGAAVIAIFGLIVTSGLVAFERQAETERYRAAVDVDALTFIHAIENETEEIEQHLAGIAGLYRATDEVSGVEFRRYVDTAGLPPALLGVAFSPRLAPHELEKFQSEMGRLIPGYAVWDAGPDGPLPPAEREWYYPVQHFEPIEVQQSSYGLNAESLPGRAELIAEAIASGEAKATEVAPLAISKDPGFLVYMPVTRANGEVVGILSAPVVLERLEVSGLPPGFARDLAWQVYDVTTAGAMPSDVDGYTSSQLIPIIDRVWQIDVVAQRSQAPLSPLEIAIVSGGLLATLFLSGLAFVMIRRRQTQRLLETVEQMLADKESFIASVSHELRTPLTGVLGFAEALRDTETVMGDEERAELISTIASEAQDLSDIVEDLIVMARSDHGTLVVASVPVEIRAQCAQVLESLPGGQFVTVDAPEASSRAIADPARVRQIIRNLVTNAQSYGGDEIGVVIDVADGQVHLAVYDDGEGVPADKAESIFEPYERAHRALGKAASLGLGLSISRKLARAMGGDLSYRREAGRTKFLLSLPVSEVEAPAAAMAQSASGA